MTRKFRDELCYGWVHEDGSFEQQPMPGDWQYDFRGAQILISRMKRGFCEPPIFLSGGRPKTLEEIFGEPKAKPRIDADTPAGISLWPLLVAFILLCMGIAFLASAARG